MSSKKHRSIGKNSKESLNVVRVSLNAEELQDSIEEKTQLESERLQSAAGLNSSGSRSPRPKMFGKLGGKGKKGRDSGATSTSDSESSFEDGPRSRKPSGEAKISAGRMSQLVSGAVAESRKEGGEVVSLSMRKSPNPGERVRPRSGSWRGTVLRSSLSYSECDDDSEMSVAETSELESKDADDEEANDAVYMWGQRVPTFSNPSSVPRALPIKGINASVQQVALGSDHYVLLTDTRQVWTWGVGEMGQLGHSERRSCYAPRILEGINDVAFVAAGGSQSGVLTDKGEIKLWGWAGPTGPRPVFVPTSIKSLEGRRIESLALGTKHGVLATSHGTVYTWGSNSEGQLGLGAEMTQDFVDLPVEVMLTDRCFFVCANEWACSVVSTKGTVFFWGQSWKENKVYQKPTKLNFFPSGRDKVVKTALGSRHILALTVLGHVMGIGNGENGQLGNGAPPQSSFSDAVSITFGKAVPAGGSDEKEDDGKRNLRSRLHRIRSPSMGNMGGSKINRGSRSHSISARLAINSRTQSTPPLTAASRVKDITAGGDRSLAVTEDGKVWEWGTNDTIIAPRVVKELQDISMAGVVCNPTCVAVLVGLRSDEDLKFHSFNPPLIKAASLERLVQWIYNEKTKPSPLYAYTLLLTHKCYTTTDELLQMVHDSYTNGNEHIRNKLSHFIVRMLQERGEDVMEPPFRDQMEALLEILEGKIVNVAVNIASRLWEPTPRIHEADPEPVRTADVSRLLHNKSATAVAEQLTLQEHRVYRRINGREFIGQGWSKPDKMVLAPGIVHMTQRFNKLSRRIIAHIINCQSRSDRTQRYQWWVEVHRQLFNLNNFNVCMCVSGALSSVPVERLAKRSLIEVKASSTKWLTFFGDLIKLNNKAGYRKSLKRVMDESEPAIPYIGVHMSDLTFIEDGNKDKLGDLINFRKYRMIAKQVRTLEQLATRKYVGLQSDPELASVFAVIDPPDMDELDAITEQIIQGSVSSPSQPRRSVAASERIGRPDLPSKPPVEVAEQLRVSQQGPKRVDAWNELVPRCKEPEFIRDELPGIVEDVLMNPLASLEEENMFTALCADQEDFVETVSAMSLTEPNRDLIRLFVSFAKDTTHCMEIRAGLIAPLKNMQEQYVRLMQERTSAVSLRSSKRVNFSEMKKELEAEKQSIEDEEEALKLKLLQLQEARELIEEKLANMEKEYDSGDKNIHKKVTIMQTIVGDAGEALSTQKKAVRLFEKLMISRTTKHLEMFREGEMDSGEKTVRQQFIEFSRNVVLPMIQSLAKQDEYKPDARTLGLLLKEVKHHVFPKSDAK